MRIACVGAGFWASFQLNGWREVPGVELVGISNQTVEKAVALGEQFKIPAFGNLTQMIEATNPDVADIITSPSSHPAVLAEAVSHGKKVICQKPLAETYQEANQMVELCRERGLDLLVNENWRYQRPLQAMGKLLRDGVIGEPLRARMQFSSSFPVYDNQPFLKTIERFILADVGSHLLDTARSLFGEAESLLCRTSRTDPEVRGEDMATIFLKMSGCPSVVIELSYGTPWADEAFPQTYCFIEGTKGSLHLGKDYVLTTTTRTSSRQEVATPPSYPWLDPAYLVVHSSIVDCQRALAADLIQGIPSGLRGHENLRSIALVEACYASAETGEQITFSL